MDDGCCISFLFFQSCGTKSKNVFLCFAALKTFYLRFALQSQLEQLVDKILHYVHKAVEREVGLRVNFGRKFQQFPHNKRAKDLFN